MDTSIIQLTDTQYRNKARETYPWFTRPCLEWLNTIDLSDKNILEFGSGDSTLWFAKRCKQIVSIEAKEEWYQRVRTGINSNATIILRQTNEGDQSKINYYCVASDELLITFDIIIVDGVLRNECLRKGIELLSKKGGIIIADNWQQHSVWISEDAEQLMKPFKTTLFVEPSRAHEENPWKTAEFEIPISLKSNQIKSK